MCTKPLKGFKYGKTAKGKDNYIITSYKVDHLEVRPNGKIEKCYDNSIINRAITSFIDIPCGKCLECRLEYSKQWANRCMLEAQQYENNCFVTLTYNDDHIPVNLFPSEYNIETGEPISYNESFTLYKKDLQNFIKRLRSDLNRTGNYDKDGNSVYLKKTDKDYHDIKYFACGEYGGKTKRPHYHLIIFNFKPNDLIPIGQNISGDMYYKSPYLEKLWPNGFNLVANVTWNSCAYVSRYVTKKISNNVTDQIYKNLNVDPEFIIMSKGIGKKWYILNNVCYATFENNYIKTDEGARKISPNRYFDKLLDKENPDLLCEIKKKRKDFQYYHKKIELQNTNLPYLDYLDIKESNLSNKTKSLRRKEL